MHFVRFDITEVQREALSNLTVPARCPWAAVPLPPSCAPASHRSGYNGLTAVPVSDRVAASIWLPSAGLGRC